MRHSIALRVSLVVSLACALVAPAVLTACGSKPETPPAPSTAAPAAPTAEPLVAIALPTNLNAEKVALGRRLFHDSALSGDGTVSCATCHSLDMGGAEHRRVSIGIAEHNGPINSPTVLNSSLNFVQFWDGRARTLEEQAAGPIANPLEMGGSLEAAVTSLKSKPEYVRLFSAAYSEGLTPDTLVHAIAEYERSLITPAPFDAFLGGNQTAISAQAKRGYETFKSVGCTTCHTGQNVGGSMYQKMGLVRNYFELRGTPLTEADHGRFNVTHAAGDRHMFKVPTLRNIALTAPYFHDGSQETLVAAVKLMGQVQLGRELTDAQIADIIAFLVTLTGEIPASARPTADELVPSSVPAVDSGAAGEGFSGTSVRSGSGVQSGSAGPSGAPTDGVRSRIDPAIFGTGRPGPSGFERGGS